MKRDELEKRAAVLGIKPATLRMQMYRETLRARAKSYQEPPFETFGLKLTHKFARDLKGVRRRLEHAATFVGKARIEVERLLRSELNVPLDQLTRTWAAELDGTGVRVNSIDPGSMDTAMHRAAEPEEDPAQWARPESVTTPFVWLGSDAAAGVNGQRFEAQAFAGAVEV